MFTMRVNVYLMCKSLSKATKCSKSTAKPTMPYVSSLLLPNSGENARLSSSEIQREMLIPQALMPRIVAQLARAGLLNTFPGRDGGLMLPRPAAQITLRDVVEAFEGPILLSECLQAKVRMIAHSGPIVLSTRNGDGCRWQCCARWRRSPSKILRRKRSGHPVKVPA